MPGCNDPSEFLADITELLNDDTISKENLTHRLQSLKIENDEYLE